MNFPDNWQILERFVEIRSSWLTLIGEKIEDEQKQILDYWRVEKANSVVIITMQSDLQAGRNYHRFLLPKPSFRPGIGKKTLDFPGGRVLPEQIPVDAVPVILQRELGIKKLDITSLQPLNQTGWAINSSFSNQKLYGFAVEINCKTVIDPEKLAPNIYPTTANGINYLLQDLTCLQCRAMLLEWRQNTQHQFTD